MKKFQDFTLEDRIHTIESTIFISGGLYVLFDVIVKKIIVNEYLIFITLIIVLIMVGTLANNFGNLCQRVFSFIEKNCNNKIPKSAEKNKADEKIIKTLKDEIPNLIEIMNKQDLNNYIKTVVNFSFNANKYFNDAQPWAEKKERPERMNAIIHTIMDQIKDISILLSPIIPLSSCKILDAMNIDVKHRNIEGITKNNILNHDLELKKPGILFKKIENDH